MKKEFPKKRVSRKIFSVNITQRFFAFHKTISKYFKSVSRSLGKKAAKLKNTLTCAYSIDSLAKQSLVADNYFREVKADLKAKTEELCNGYFKNLQTSFGIPKNIRIIVRQIIFENKKQIAEILSREVTILKDTKYPLAFKPAFAAQGIFVFAVFLFFAIAIQTIVFPPQKLNTAQLINHQSINTKQLTAAVAGKNSPAIQWTKLIEKSDITENQKLLIIPKNAKHIKVSVISKQQAEQITNAVVLNPAAQLTTQDRKQLAGRFNLDLAGINFKSTNTAGLMEAKELVFRVLSAVNSYFLADLESAVIDAVEQIAEQIAPPPVDTSAGSAQVQLPTTEIQNTIIVDLSNQAVEIPSSSVTTIVATTEDKTKDKDTKETLRQAQGEATKEEKQETKDKQEPDVISPEISQTPPEPIEPSVPAEGGPLEVPSTSGVDDYVQVTYDTPAPTITEQETDTGKMVTVSSNETEKVDCESLNPSPVVRTTVLSPAGLLNGFKNIIASITKFFT
ncbi:MAG: hypothetical protein AAB509_00960, partial [Patescibacteria group bacterium]